MIESDFGRVSQVVRHGSAKAVFVGSSPTLASKILIDDGRLGKGGEECFLAVAGIAHPKPRQEPRPGRGRYGVNPQRLRRSFTHVPQLRDALSRAKGAKGVGRKIGNWGLGLRVKGGWVLSEAA